MKPFKKLTMYDETPTTTSANTEIEQQESKEVRFDKKKNCWFFDTWPIPEVVAKAIQSLQSELHECITANRDFQEDHKDDQNQIAQLEKEKIILQELSDKRLRIMNEWIVKYNLPQTKVVLD